ncbi:hypothetical protein AX774_g22 [Zancudomyces culisetae]|uniref:Uncharacterized protein n=1 Tax=Zancudomyces culisetae TaxID=1213189 RepID=A0A1R1PZL8_ZANCU|nr:hypothetical protein AX774_g22 [Zancudomyces culisetae]|eukprot:OMH86408.1 hypothetical protein AX774_g22 [Zancudomyces culisetae]
MGNPNTIIPENNTNIKENRWKSFLYWVFSKNGSIPKNAIIVQNDLDNQTQVIARGLYNGNYYPGICVLGTQKQTQSKTTDLIPDTRESNDIYSSDDNSEDNTVVLQTKAKYNQIDNKQKENTTKGSETSMYCTSFYIVYNDSPIFMNSYYVLCGDNECVLWNKPDVKKSLSYYNTHHGSSTSLISMMLGQNSALGINSNDSGDDPYGYSTFNCIYSDDTSVPLKIGFDDVGNMVRLH